MKFFVVLVVFFLWLGLSFDAGADTCYLVDPPVYEDEASALTVRALTQLEWALVLIGREPGEPPFRGDPVTALKKAISLTKEALKETR